MLKDLKLKYNSPFVNLWIFPTDFLNIIENLKESMETELTFLDCLDITYPVGQINGNRILFQHFSSKDEALEKWNRRVNRINYNNLFFMMTDRDGCTYDDIKRFDSLPFKNKVIFTNKKYPEFQSAFYIKGFENEESVGLCFEPDPNSIGRTYYDQFDYVKWFNNTL